MVQWLRLQNPNAGGPGSIPDQGTSSHMLPTETHCSQINKTKTDEGLPPTADQSQKATSLN